MRPVRILSMLACIFVGLLTTVAGSDEARTKECRTDFTIYIDLSRTVTDNRGQGQVPLYTLSAMLSRLFTEDDRFARDGDRIHIMALGDTVVPLTNFESLDAEAREELQTRLAKLSGSSWPESEFVKKNINNISAFATNTNFQSFFEDVTDRLVGPNSGRRQLFIVASDFVDDPKNDCDEAGRTTHMTNAISAFRDRPEIREAFVPGNNRQPPAQMILLATSPPNRCEGLDKKLADALLTAWAPLQPHLVQDFQKKGEIQLTTDVRERSTPAIRIGAVTASGSRLKFKIFNPTCVPVTVDKVILSRTNDGPTSAGVPLPLKEPVTVPWEKEESPVIELDDPQVKTWHNQDLTLQPIVIGVKSAPVTFWNGDTLKVERALPRLLPQFGNDGKLILILDLRVQAEENQRYRFELPEVPARSDDKVNENSHEVTVVASGDEEADRRMVLVYDVANEVLERLGQRKNLTLHPVPLDDARVTGTVNADGTSQTVEPIYNLAAKLVPPITLLIVAAGMLVNLLFRMFGRGDTFREALATSVNVATVVAAIVLTLALRPLNWFNWFDGKPVYTVAVSLGVATWIVCLFGIRGAILAMWEVIFRGKSGEHERSRRDALARLLFWASQAAGVFVFWTITHYIAAWAPIVTEGPK